jgi:ABC-type dipeptide/oligopeptide/nickel transport system ATPase subunit
MNDIMLNVVHLSKSFTKSGNKHTVLSDVSFNVREQECLGIVGESGCGKSTLMNIIAGLERPDSGEIKFSKLTKIHMVFQNPLGAFDPQQKLGAAVMEGMLNMGMEKKQAKAKMLSLFAECGIPADCSMRYPHQVSGGECQRIAFARALACNPELLICDEATSALDITVQEQILELMHKIRKNRKITILFVSHDLAVVQEVCSMIIVMHRGRICEAGTTEAIIKTPQEPYTKELLDSIL